jgi:hypothetical protein
LSSPKVTIRRIACGSSNIPSPVREKYRCLTQSGTPRNDHSLYVPCSALPRARLLMSVARMEMRHSLISGMSRLSRMARE